MAIDPLRTQLERAAERADDAARAFFEVLTFDEETPVEVEGGQTVPSMDARIEAKAQVLEGMFTGIRDEAQNAADQASMSASNAASAASIAEAHKNAAANSAAEAAESAEEAKDAEEEAKATLPTVSIEPPTDRYPGKRWIKQDTGRIYEWFIDGESNGQWVELMMTNVIDNQSALAELAKPEGVSKVNGAAWYADAIIGFDATKVPDGATVIFSGRREAGDGGGGVFTYSKSSTATPDYGLVYAPTGGGRLIRNGWTVFGFNGPVNPRWWGARGDGNRRPLSTYFSTLTDAQVHYPAAQSLDEEVDGAAIRRALDSGNNVLVSKGVYPFNQQLKLSTNGQMWTGEGIDSVELRWVGNAPSLNAVWISSGRLDSGNQSTYRRGRIFGGMRFSMYRGSKCRTLLWFEQGCVADSYREINVTPISGRPTEAVVKFDSESAGEGGGYSYGCSTYKLMIRGGIELDENGDPVEDPSPIPVGVLVQGLIESSFICCEVYQCDVTWRYGDPDPGKSRNVESIVALKCSGETGVGSTRANGTNDGAALEIYHAVNVQHYGCKYVANAQGGEGYQRVIRVGTGAVGRAVDFWGGFFWSNASRTQTGPAIELEDGSGLIDLNFHSPSLNIPGQLVAMGDDVDTVIGWDNPKYGTSIPSGLPLNCKFSVRGAAVTGRTVEAAEVVATSIPEVGVAFGTPMLASYTKALHGMMVNAYRSSGFTNGAVAIANGTGSSQTLETGRVRLRYFDESEIRTKRFTTWDPPAIASGAQTKIDVPVHGVQLGDFVVAGFAVLASGGIGGVIPRAYVAAPGVVSVLLVNATSISRNFAQGNLAVYALNPTFDLYAAVTFTPGSINSGSTDTTTVSVPGAAMGDFVCVSFSQDLAGLNVWGEVTAAGTVTVYLNNRTGSTVSGIPEGTLAVGVFKRHSTM